MARRGDQQTIGRITVQRWWQMRAVYSDIRGERCLPDPGGSENAGEPRLWVRQKVYPVQSSRTAE